MQLRPLHRTLFAPINTSPPLSLLFHAIPSFIFSDFSIFIHLHKPPFSQPKKHVLIENHNFFHHSQNQMIPSTHNNIHIIPIERANPLPCSSPCFFPHNISRKQNMSTTSSVCEGLQSCLEPLLLEPRVLMHQLVPSKPVLSFPWPHKQTELPRAENSKNCPIEKICESNRNGEESLSTWNFIKSLTNPSYNCRKLTDEPEKVYVHPLDKRSTSSLSTRSLEMCTESLGSETGNNIDSSIDEFSYDVLQKQSSSGIKQPKTREFIKKVKHNSSFPPPLTSIGGSEGVQVQTHREGGRLVIKAFSFSSCSTYFQAERENGRLRLSLLKNSERGSDDESAENEEEDVNEPEKDCDESDDEADFNGRFWGENLKDDGGKVGCKIAGGAMVIGVAERGFQVCHFVWQFPERFVSIGV